MKKKYINKYIVPSLLGSLFILSSCSSVSSKPINSTEKTNTASNNTFSNKVNDELDKAIQQTFKEFGVDGIIAGVYIPGKGGWESSIGVANRETKEKITKEHVFRIGSLTKTFTGTILLRLADKKIVGLDDPVSKYVSGVPNGDDITLRMLSNMSAGLGSYTFSPEFLNTYFANPENKFTPQQLLDISFKEMNSGCVGIIKEAGPNSRTPCFKPGKGWFYSNTNTVLLAVALEKATNKTYANLLKEYVTEPLKLTVTSQPSDNNLPNPFARGFTRQGVPDDKSAKDATNWSPSFGYAVGDMISNFSDMKIWGKALGSGELLSEEMKKERFNYITPENSTGKGYGIGIALDNGWWGHNGSLPGYNSVVKYRKDLDAVLVILTNADSSLSDLSVKGGPSDSLANKIKDIINNEYKINNSENSK